MSASAWQGCSQSLSALTTGMDAKRRQFFKIDVPENPRNNAIHPQGEISGQVRNGFAFAQLTLFRAQENRPCPELPDCNLECDSGSKRRLFENQRYVFSCKGLMADRALNRRDASRSANSTAVN
jgi:hypothetical protein